MNVTVTRCDHCGKDIATGARSFTFQAILSLTNGVHHAPRNRSLEDVCGEECLHSALTALTREVEQG